MVSYRLIPSRGPSSSQLLALQPLHVNLAWVLEQVGQHTGGAQAMITRLSERLAAFSGAMTFSYLDNDDPQPGLREIEHLTSTIAACMPELPPELVSVAMLVPGP